MSCTSPLYRIPDNSFDFKLLYNVDRKRLRNKGVFLPYEALKAYEQLPLWRTDEVQVLPCGQCASCRLAYSRDWAVRCSLEAMYHDYNYFITLTYDDAHLPRGEFIDYAGDMWDSNLCRRDVQLFLKQLREWERTTNNNTGIKVFYCGEYGSERGRPHYHICLFGASEIPDLSYRCTKGSYKYYKSMKYESFWSVRENGISVPRGFVDISECSFDTIAYTARYCMKKQQGVMKREFLEYYNSLDPTDLPDLRTPCFIGMSLKPGIASQYWNENKCQIKLEDKVKYQKKFKLFTSRPPRYFDKLFDNEDPEGYSKVKERRKASSIVSRRFKSSQFSESDLERMARENELVLSKEKKYRVRCL